MKALPLLGLCLVSGCLRSQNVTHVTVAGRDVAVWKPVGAAPPSGYPLIIFSHGLGGCNTQSTFLMTALANAGYLVVAPNHADGRCGTARASRRDPSSSDVPEPPVRDDSKWSDASYRVRATDVEAVLDSILRARVFEGVPVDAERIGIAGHSLGGYTALGLAGAWPSWKDARIKAVLALSPYCTPFVARGALGHLDVPTMYQGGTWDFGITPSVRRLQGAYDLSSTPKYYVEFTRAGHFAWTDLNPRFQSLIDRYSIAFFDRYVKGLNNPDPLAGITRTPLPDGISYLRADLKRGG